MKKNRRRQRGRSRSRRPNSTQRTQPGVRGRRSIPLASSRQLRVRNSLKTLHFGHREYVRDIVSDGSGLQSATYQVNPGLQSVFPWLSGIASNFETYKFRKLRFEYVPSVTTQAAGRVALIPDYDADDDNSAMSKAQLMSFVDTTSGPLWVPLSMNCDPSNLNKRKNYFVRRTSANQGIRKQYDALQLTIHWESSDAITLGELWVSYELVLETPQLQTTTYHSAYTYSTDDTTPFNYDNTEVVYDPNDIIKLPNDGSSGWYFDLTEPGQFTIVADQVSSSGGTAHGGFTTSGNDDDSSVTVIDESFSSTAANAVYKLVTGDTVTKENPLRFNYYGSDAAGLITKSLVSVFGQNSKIWQGA